MKLPAHYSTMVYDCYMPNKPTPPNANKQMKPGVSKGAKAVNANRPMRPGTPKGAKAVAPKKPMNPMNEKKKAEERKFKGL